jgi:sulfur-carrier protein
VTVHILYFAWVRETVGRGEEHVELPAGLITPVDVMAWLAGRSPEHATAFATPEMLRCAVDQVMVDLHAAINTPKEIAFFPPVTGG